RLRLLPPGLVADPDGLRYFSDSLVWTGAGLQASSGRGAAAQLTYSFPADGTPWGSGFLGGPSELTARVPPPFRASHLHRGRELIRQALAGWRRIAGLTYTEVADDNSPQDSSTGRISTRGDCRIGAVTLDGLNGILAYDSLPSGGADMVLDAADFGGNFN